MMGQKQKQPCGDCVDGHCTMNCGPRIPADVRSAMLGGIGNVNMKRTMIPINADALTYESPRDLAAIPFLKVKGVGRVADEPRAVLVLLTERPTDDELRSLHEFLRGWCQYCGGSKTERYLGRGNNEDTRPCSYCNDPTW